MDRLDITIKNIKEKTGVIIENKTHDDLILFNVNTRFDSREPSLVFSGITGQEEFKVTFASLYLSECELKNFIDNLIVLQSIVKQMNCAISDYKTDLKSATNENLCRCCKQPINEPDKPFLKVCQKCANEFKF